MRGHAPVVLAAALAVSCGDFPDHLLNRDGAPADHTAFDVPTSCSPPDSVCGSRCSGPASALVRRCTAAGQCGPETAQSCDPFRCVDGGCLEGCKTDNDCASGAYTCNNGWCLSRDGQACQQDTDCNSGICKDGVCCDKACDGLCESCVVPGSVGVCTLIADGQDPDNECVAQGAETCKTDGACDGLGACRLYAAGTACAGPTACAGAETVKVPECDGLGACTTVPKDCFPYQCDAGACLTGCTSSNEAQSCAGNMACIAGKCASSCVDDKSCQGMWGCDTSTSKCHTHCTSDTHCSSEGQCNTGTNQCESD